MHSKAKNLDPLNRFFIYEWMPIGPRICLVASFRCHTVDYSYKEPRNLSRWQYLKWVSHLPRLEAMDMAQGIRIFVFLLCMLGITGPCLATSGQTNLIGINYGQFGNDLPSPDKVKALIQSTSITTLKIYDSNPAVIGAFSNSGIDVIVGVKNEEIAPLHDVQYARIWVKRNVASHLPATRIKMVSVGNEVLTSNNTLLHAQLLSAMQNLHTAITELGLRRHIMVSTPHSFSILSKTFPPSSAIFQQENLMKQILMFLNQTESPLMVNTYPYFAYKRDPQHVSLAYALFQANQGVLDSNTGLKYSNLFDAQIDAIYYAMEKLGYSNSIKVLVSETGWPSAGDAAESGVSLMNAMTYNKNLIAHVLSNTGTPSRPNMNTQVFLFALFNENQKPGPKSERNFGLFYTNLTAVYDVGLRSHPIYIAPPPPPPSPYGTVMPAPPPPKIPLPPATKPPSPVSPPPKIPLPPATKPPPSPPPRPHRRPRYAPPPPNTLPPYSPKPPSPSNPSPNPTRVWCIAKPGVDTAKLQNALNYACGEGGADCSAIQPGGSCFQPNNVASHASFAFNMYYQKHGRNYWNCDFRGAALLSVSNPSFGSCIYPSQ